MDAHRQAFAARVAVVGSYCSEFPRHFFLFIYQYCHLLPTAGPSLPNDACTAVHANYRHFFPRYALLLSVIRALSLDSHIRTFGNSLFGRGEPSERMDADRQHVFVVLYWRHRVHAVRASFWRQELPPGWHLAANRNCYFDSAVRACSSAMGVRTGRASAAGLSQRLAPGGHVRALEPDWNVAQYHVCAV